MVYKIKGKRGQAAIEFLMTYGWMLLVVLIVGALIFSFVDFGSLLPNKVDISSPNILPIVSDSYATGSGVDSSGDPINNGIVVFAFKYNGVRPIEFTLNETTNANEKLYVLDYNFGDSSCSNATKIYNRDIDNSITNASTSPDDQIRFRTGHSGYIQFESCEDFSQFDVLEGDIKVTFTSTQTGSETPVFGTVRFTKQ